MGRVFLVVLKMFFRIDVYLVVVGLLVEVFLVVII